MFFRNPTLRGLRILSLDVGFPVRLFVFDAPFCNLKCKLPLWLASGFLAPLLRPEILPLYDFALWFLVSSELWRVFLFAFFGFGFLEFGFCIFQTGSASRLNWGRGVSCFPARNHPQIGAREGAGGTRTAKRKIQNPNSKLRNPKSEPSIPILEPKFNILQPNTQIVKSTIKTNAPKQRGPQNCHFALLASLFAHF